MRNLSDWAECDEHDDEVVIFTLEFEDFFFLSLFEQESSKKGKICKVKILN